MRWLLVLLLPLCACDLFAPPPTDIDGDGWAEFEDCDDLNAAVFPGAGESCDGADNDCDGAIDEGHDEDGDGVLPCSDPADCDDSDPAVYPGALELCDQVDNDCNGLIDDGGAADADGDGFCPPTDCDDTDPAIRPTADEVCNGVDDNCDGQIDEGWDADGDGYSPCGGVDCDDDNPDVNPGAGEVCNGLDEDCDEQIDEDFDNDGDGYTTCSDPCNDGNASVRPGATELCNQADDDCDGDIDEGAAEDFDGDGYDGCTSDCDDADPNVRPGAADLPDGIDNDCDGVVDGGYVGDLGIETIGPVAQGAGTSERIGDALAVGDFNGDGLSDFVSGSGFFDDARGKISLFLGTPYDIGSPPATLAAQFSVAGTVPHLRFGYSVALGDVDDDGYDDLIVGEQQGSPSNPSPPGGRVYVWFGSASPPSGARATGTADVVIDGSFPTEQCGHAVAFLGDVNNDGTGDFGFTCPWFNRANVIRGRTAVFFGRTTWNVAYDVDGADALIEGTDDDPQSGDALVGQIDWNHDGVDDFAVGSAGWNSDTGRMALFQGGSVPTDGDLGDAPRLLTGNTAWPQRIGGYLAAGDADDDGVNDLLFAGPDANDGHGMAGVAIGASPAPTSTSAFGWSPFYFQGASGEAAGTALAVVDLDGDGTPEVHIGVPGWDGPGGDRGQVLAMEGPLGALGSPAPASAASWSLLGGDDGDYLGSSLLALPDFNGDGSPDLAVGAPFWGSQDHGRVVIVPGY